MNTSQLRTRHWLSDCPSFSFGVSATETYAGQFNTIEHAAYQVSCIVESHGYHTMRPVSADEFDAELCDEEDSDLFDG